MVLGDISKVFDGCDWGDAERKPAESDSSIVKGECEKNPPTAGFKFKAKALLASEGVVGRVGLKIWRLRK